MNQTTQSDTPRADAIFKQEHGDYSLAMLGLCRTLERENAELRKALAECVEAMQVERNEYGEWVSRRHGGRYREAIESARAALAKVQP